MKYYHAAALAAGLFSSAEAISLAKRDASRPALPQLDIQRRDVNPILHDKLRRRASNTLQATLDNLETLYFANVSLGTPEQSLRLHIDTGSSDLWTNSANSQICQARNGAYCAEGGSYSANDSSTYNYVDSNFNISYVDGSSASGDYVTDTLHFAGATLTDFQFGIGYDSTNQQGIMGIGYKINEASVTVSGTNTYPNLPVSLVEAGIISTNTYSLWLNDLDANTGSILFGGVDSDKYTGNLQTLPIVPQNGYYAEFIIAMTALDYNGDSVASNVDVPVLLDSGSSLIYLPDSMVQTIYNKVGATFDSNAQLAIIDCSMAESSDTIDFTFSSPKISIPMNELVLLEGYQGNQPVCVFGISPNSGSTSILGDTFLRSAYVVYDLSNNEISIAQTNFNATSSNVQEITNASNIPGASVVANAVSTAAVATGGSRIQGWSSMSSSGMAAMPTVPPQYAYGAALAAGAGILAAAF